MPWPHRSSAGFQKMQVQGCLETPNFPRQEPLAFGVGQFLDMQEALLSLSLSTERHWLPPAIGITPNAPP